MVRGLSKGLPRLDKEAVASKLQARFEGGFLGLKDLPDPFELYDMQKAAERIAKAVREGEQIAVVGDYDVDGVVSSALMGEFFETIGVDATVTIPNRFRDGYGLSPGIVEQLEADLIVTVDNGITAIEAAEVCKAKGIDLIITDHHTPADTLPDAYAIVNPKRAECRFLYPEICGAQVAWFLIGALKKSLGLELKMGRFLDLLALAIIADVMPLQSINRPLVQKGLQMLAISKRPAFEVVRAYLGKDRFSAEDVAFSIAPRINSAGRMEDASVALAFLRAKSLQEASEAWQQLERLNQWRRDVESQTSEEAMTMVRAEDAVIVVAGEGWHEGVVGIVASRLVDRFSKPAIVLSIDGERAKGSGRSVGEVDLYGLLECVSDSLLGFGGHKMAAGLLLEKEKIDTFSRTISQAAQKVPPELYLPKERVMGVLPFSQIDWELMAILERFEPYGEANRRPVFFFEGVEVLEAKAIGVQKEHLKLLLQEGEKRLSAIWFRFEEAPQKGARISFTATLQVNEFRREKTIQLLIDQII